MFVLQIIFAIAAWKRGWCWRALLPFAVLFGTSFFVGMAVTAAGGTIEKAYPVIMLLEIGTLISLIVMTCVRRGDPRPTKSRILTAAQELPQAANH